MLPPGLELGTHHEAESWHPPDLTRPAPSSPPVAERRWLNLLWGGGQEFWTGTAPPR